MGMEFPKGVVMIRKLFLGAMMLTMLGAYSSEAEACRRICMTFHGSHCFSVDESFFKTVVVLLQPEVQDELLSKMGAKITNEKITNIYLKKVTKDGKQMWAIEADALITGQAQGQTATLKAKVHLELGYAKVEVGTTSPLGQILHAASIVEIRKVGEKRTSIRITASATVSGIPRLFRRAACRIAGGKLNTMFCQAECAIRGALRKYKDKTALELLYKNVSDLVEDPKKLEAILK
jgi:chorismate-pyruvate lyase